MLRVRQQYLRPLGLAHRPCPRPGQLLKHLLLFRSQSQFPTTRLSRHACTSSTITFQSSDYRRELMLFVATFYQAARGLRNSSSSISPGDTGANSHRVLVLQRSSTIATSAKPSADRTRQTRQRSLLLMLCCPLRLPVTASRRLPGGTRRSSRTEDPSNWDSPHSARRSLPTRRRTLPPAKSACVSWHLKLWMVAAHRHARRDEGQHRPLTGSAGRPVPRASRAANRTSFRLKVHLPAGW